MRVPDTFRADDADVADAVTERRIDYVWHQPHVYELESRLVLPAGYSAPTLVASETRALGTMTLTTSRRRDGDALVITYRLDTGKRRITASELRATRAAVLALQGAANEHVILSQVGATLLHDGKIKEALREFHRLVALHPTEAIHHAQLAETYRQAGMGAAARRAAREGVRVEPTSGDAYSVLGFQLRRDTTGRDHGFDADRAGAIAAYRKALVLTPAHVGAMTELAGLLAVDERGWPTTVRRDLLEAIALWRRANERSDSHDYDQVIVETLLAASSHAEAEAAARALPASDTSAALQVTAAAAGRGARAALLLARSLATGPARTQLITDVRGRLMGLRLYEPMRQLHAEIAGSTEPRQALMIANLVRVDPTTLDPRDPTTPVRLAVLPILSVPAASRPWSDDLATDLAVAANVATGMTGTMRALPRAVVVDLSMATATLTTVGSATDGWRVEFDGGNGRMGFYVVLDKAGARLIGGTGMTTDVGRLMLALVARKDVAGAARWLKRVIDDVGTAPSDDTLEDLLAIYHDEIAGAAGTPPSASLEVAAALLVAPHAPATAVPILRRCAVAGTTSSARCRAGLLRVLRALERWDEAATMAGAVVADPDRVLVGAYALAAGGRFDEAIAALEQALATAPTDLQLLNARALVAIEAEGWTKAQPLVAKVVAHPAIDAGLLNLAGWLSAYHDPVLANARQLGNRAQRMTTAMAAQLANTLAVIEAEADEPYQAWQYLQKAPTRRLEDPPMSADWYAIGRIAESYGLRADAIAAYRKIARQPRQVGVVSEYDFAQRALVRLGATAPVARPTGRRPAASAPR